MWAGSETLLADDELQRANRFRAERHRERFLVGRGSLRCLLARYLAIDPWKVAFRYEDFGKPVLASNAELQFNLTHSHGLALCAWPGNAGSASTWSSFATWWTALASSPASSPVASRPNMLACPRI